METVLGKKVWDKHIRNLRKRNTVKLKELVSAVAYIAGRKIYPTTAQVKRAIPSLNEVPSNRVSAWLGSQSDLIVPVGNGKQRRWQVIPEVIQSIANITQSTPEESVFGVDSREVVETTTQLKIEELQDSQVYERVRYSLTTPGNRTVELESLEDMLKIKKALKTKNPIKKITESLTTRIEYIT